MKSILVGLFIALATPTLFGESATVEIGGMSCGNCIKNITKKLCNKEKFATCEVSMGKAVVTSKSGEKLDMDFLKAAIDSEDGHYKVKNVTLGK